MPELAFSAFELFTAAAVANDPYLRIEHLTIDGIAHICVEFHDLEKEAGLDAHERWDLEQATFWHSKVLDNGWEEYVPAEPVEPIEILLVYGVLWVAWKHPNMYVPGATLVALWCLFS